MAEVSYLLCAITSLVCFLLLLRSFFQNRSRLLLWSSLCFAFFTVQNVLLVVDLIMLPTQINLAVWRSLSGFVGALVLLLALIWEYR